MSYWQLQLFAFPSSTFEVESQCCFNNALIKMASYFLPEPDMRKYTATGRGRSIYYCILSYVWKICKMYSMCVGSLYGKVLPPQTSVKVSAQTRDRILRIAVVPFCRRPTLHSTFQQSTVEQFCANRENAIIMMRLAMLNTCQAILCENTIWKKILFPLNLNNMTKPKFKWKLLKQI